MCMIALKTKGAHLSDDEIRYDFLTNGNGAGFMYAMNGRVYWEKGFFNVDDLLSRWHELIKDDMVAALHTRIATHGNRNCTELCHPFPLDGSDVFRSSGSAPLVMMHNGIIPEKSWKDFAIEGDSDTSAFARRLTPILNNTLPDEGYAGLVKGYDGNSRFLFMNGDGEFVTVGRWYEENGIKFSNNHYKGLISEKDWAAYGRDRGFSYYNYSSSVWDRYNIKPAERPNLYSTPTISKNEIEPGLFDDEDFDEDENINVRSISLDDLYELADSYGLIPVDDGDSEGELQGNFAEETYYFILDDNGGNYDSINNTPYDVRVYEYDADEDSFVESNGVWYHYYENPEQLKFANM